jgi:hypothetical protein
MLQVRPRLWSSGQSSWLLIQRSGFDSLRYQIFWEVVCLERGPLNLMSTIEELLEWKSSGPGLENRDYGSREPSRWPRSNLYPQKLALISLKSGGRSVGIVRSRTQATEFSFSVNEYNVQYHAVKEMCKQYPCLQLLRYAHRYRKHGGVTENDKNSLHTRLGTVRSVKGRT